MSELRVSLAVYHLSDPFPSFRNARNMFHAAKVAATFTVVGGNYSERKYIDQSNLVSCQETYLRLNDRRKLDCFTIAAVSLPPFAIRQSIM